MSPKKTRFASVAIGLVTGLACLLAGPAVASADPVEYTYQINGTAHVAKTKSDVPIGPGTFRAELDLSTGDFTGDFSVPKTTSKFKMFGVLDISADVEIVPSAPVRGHLENGKATAELSVDLVVSNIKAGGVFPVPTLPGCKGTEPATMSLASGGEFDPIKGGSLSGEFTLPEWGVGCGPVTPFINLLVAGPGNTIDLDLAAA